jgi:hypothetical protein
VPTTGTGAASEFRSTTTTTTPSTSGTSRSTLRNRRRSASCRSGSCPTTAPSERCASRSI